MAFSSNFVVARMPAMTPPPKGMSKEKDRLLMASSIWSYTPKRYSRYDTLMPGRMRAMEATKPVTIHRMRKNRPPSVWACSPSIGAAANKATMTTPKRIYRTALADRLEIFP